MDYVSRVIKSNNIKEFLPRNEKFIVIVSRPSAILLRCLFSLGPSSEDYYQKMLGYRHKYLRYNTNSQMFINQRALDEEKSKILDLEEKNPKYTEDINNSCEEKGQKLLDFSYDIKSKNFSNYSESDLIDLFKKYCQQMTEFGTFIFPVLAIEKFLEEKIADLIEKKLPDKEKLEEYYQILISPAKDSFSFQEQKNLLNLAIKYKNGEKDLNGKIKHHVFQFDGLGTKYGVGQPWTREEILTRVKKLAALKPEEKLNNLLALRKNEQIVSEITSELNLDSQEEYLVNITRSSVYIRTFRADVMSLSFININPLLMEIAKRHGVGVNIFNSLPQEIIEKQYPSEESYKKRKQYSICLGKDNYLYFCEGEVAEKIEKKLQSITGEIQTVFSKTNEIKGVIANKGEAEGKVKIVMNNTEIHKVNHGDIIVSPMTTPDFMPAMEKASAFVTDEGGILCHAAIVSREMNKPCIIGTKIATKVLKDGDRIEVDANKGVVRILK